jgi:integrase
VKKLTARTAEGIRQRSPGSFEIRYEGPRDRAGGRKALSVTFKCNTLDEAVRERRRLMAEVDAGKYVERSKLTVADYVEQRIDRWVALGAISPKTSERYYQLLAFQVAPHVIGSLELQRLKSIDVEEWHGLLLTSGRRDGGGGLSRLTVRHAHSLLSKALTEAVRHELLVRNVAALQPPPRAPDEEREVTILTAEQARAVVSLLKGRVIYPKVILALCCGLRRGEVLALRQKNVDFDRRIISVEAALEETQSGGVAFKLPKSKAGKRDITMPDLVVDVLRDARKRELEQRFALGRGKPSGDDLLFARLGGSPQSPHALSAEWRKAAESLGLGDVTFHALRHTHASHLIAHGIDVVKIAKRLGHADPTITLSTYAHLFQKLEDKSAEAVNAAVAELASA